MGNSTIFEMFENPKRGRQARNFTTNVPRTLDLKSSSEQIFSNIDGWVPLVRASALGQAHNFSLPLVEFVYTEWGGVSVTKYRNNLTCTPNRLALNS